MQVRLIWDNDEQTIVRWDFDGLIGIINYAVAFNDTAAMGIVNGGKADTIVNLGIRMPFPDRRISEMKKPIVAARHYGLGYVMIVAVNPIARLIVQMMLLRDPDMQGMAEIVPSLAQARARLAQLRAASDLQMKM